MGELAVTFAAGEGKYDEQGLYLARSLARTNPDVEIYVFVPESESPSHESELSDLGTIVRGKQTIPEYGISTKIDALKSAEQTADEEYLLLLDTDTLVFDEITVHESGHDLYLKPADIGLQYWGRESESSVTWRSLAERLDLPSPRWTEKSTFDHNPIPPYWNAGFVLTANNGFGHRWMEAVKTIYPDIPYEWHADQVTLGLLSQEYDTISVNNRYNYPLHLRIRIPDDVIVVHYHDMKHLQKAHRYKSVIRSIGLWDDVQQMDYSYLDWSWRYLKRKTLPMNERHSLERFRDAIFRRG
ncbi:hypothetical protein Hbl1158_06815 [Halobaculum sp. CBA1158]|uniref:hypothetical protein n=1 Tax=Halobaculum sp. CBA1158 TaxID=2904243 RepID=UPI001F3354F5|nr:hypothetical protein [Halobaculum sp. CBA1158]UIP01059.1 hypothetical protein Hbl1158_06815 [Halobaculum sp. CBA1158]